MSQFTSLVRTAVESIASVGIGGTYSVTRRETRHFPSPAALSVETTNGGITVRGEDRDDVAVTVTKRATSEAALDGARPVASGGGDDPLALRADHDGSPSDVAIDVEVALPADVPVESVETTNGGIELRDVTGDADAATKNGSVTAERVDGYLDLRTKNGGITAREVTGIDRAESKNGGIELAFADLRTDATVETRSGSVTVRAPRSLDADVRLSSTLGSIDAPLLGESASDVGESTVSGTVGAGGHRLDVGTKLGSVEFAERSSESDRA
jgi:DUF4097 and DUF4098 domain-containing protein YvlB